MKSYNKTTTAGMSPAGGAILCFQEDLNPKSKIARSDNPFAYKQFAKMVVPKHVENLIQDDEPSDL